ncbi:MAG: L-seryl-tRNA(Sec) selenium transferase [Roseiflexaceae bacterium]
MASSAQLRQLPAIEALVREAEQQSVQPFPRPLLVELARTTIAAAREQIRGGGSAPSRAVLAADLLARAAAQFEPSLRPVINASGVILQTNLGRAPLSQAALAAMQMVGAGYSNLEYDLVAGERGSRSVHLQDLLCQLTGAEAALAVNNNAAAIYLALSALAAGREVIVSRGQAVEIGGGFRIPDVLRQSGATLVEVGTTNRTYVNDYAAAIGERTALLLRVHTSNFRLVGFVHETSLADLAALGQARAITVLDDLGSGTLLPTAPYGLNPEPTVAESVAAGADLVTFSGDKLLGGPQAGLIVGRRALIEQLKRHPLARALRIDKATIAGLEATLLSYLRGSALREIPIWQMISAPLEQVQQRALRMLEQIGAGKFVACASAIGGGSLPGDTLPSAAVGLAVRNPDSLAKRLRLGNPAIVARIDNQHVLLDLRTILPMQEAAVVGAVQAALAAEGHA